MRPKDLLVVNSSVVSPHIAHPWAIQCFGERHVSAAALDSDAIGTPTVLDAAHGASEINKA